MWLVPTNTSCTRVPLVGAWAISAQQLMPARAASWPTLTIQTTPGMLGYRYTPPIAGITPRHVQYLTLWPLAFETMCVLVPNLLDIPFSDFGLGTLKPSLRSLTSYTAARWVWTLRLGFMVTSSTLECSRERDDESAHISSRHSRFVDPWAGAAPTPLAVCPKASSRVRCGQPRRRLCSEHAGIAKH